MAPRARSPRGRLLLPGAVLPRTWRGNGASRPGLESARPALPATPSPSSVPQGPAHRGRGLSPQRASWGSLPAPTSCLEEAAGPALTHTEGCLFFICRGIVASILVFLCFGVTQAKDGPFSRPHPGNLPFLFPCVPRGGSFLSGRSVSVLLGVTVRFPSPRPVSAGHPHLSSEEGEGCVLKVLPSAAGSPSAQACVFLTCSGPVLSAGVLPVGRGVPGPPSAAGVGSGGWLCCGAVSHLRGILLSLSPAPGVTGPLTPQSWRACSHDRVLSWPRGPAGWGPSRTGAGRAGGFPEGSRLSDTFLSCLDRGVYLL